MIDEAMTLLRDLEWSGRSGLEGEDACCPECHFCQNEIDYNLGSGRSDEHGHDPKCRLARLVYGPVSPERIAAMAEAEAKFDAEMERYRIQSEKQQADERRAAEQRIRDMQNGVFSIYVRNSHLLPGLPR